MRKKKVLGLMLSFTLAFGLALPATMAMPLESKVEISGEYEEETNSNATATNSNAEEKIMDSENRYDDDNKSTETGSNSIATDSNATQTMMEHLETCFDGCEDKECKCPCHKLSLFERIMACKTLEELDDLLLEVNEKELLMLTEEENELICNHIKSIEPEPYPAIELKETTDTVVLSEKVYLGVSYTNVAPIGDPVIGSAE